MATPGRMKDMISGRLVDISKIDYCILDEADEMLNMGFMEDIKDILSNTPMKNPLGFFRNHAQRGSYNREKIHAQSSMK